MSFSTTAGTQRSVSQLAGTVLGAVYLAVGAIGFAVTSGTGFADTHGGKLLGIFMLNPLHNVVHVAVGAALLAAALTGARASRAVNSVVGGVYLLVGVVGLFVLGSSMNILALNEPDNGLHFASAIALLVLAASDRGRAG